MTTAAQPLPAASPSLATTGAAGRILKLDPALARALEAAGGSLPATVAGKALGGATTLTTLHGDITLKLAALLKPGLNVTLALPQNPAPNMPALVLPARGRDPAMGERAPAPARSAETKAPPPATGGRPDQTQSRPLIQPSAPNARPAAGLDAPSLEVLARAVRQGVDAPIKQIAPHPQKPLIQVPQVTNQQPSTGPVIQPKERAVPVSAEQKSPPPLSRAMTQPIDRQLVPDAARTAPQSPQRVEASSMPVNKQSPALPRPAIEPPPPTPVKGAIQPQAASLQPIKPVMQPSPATAGTPVAPIPAHAPNKTVSDSTRFHQPSPPAPQMPSLPKTPTLTDSPQPNLIPRNSSGQPQRLPTADGVQIDKNVAGNRTMVPQPDLQQRPLTSQTRQPQHQVSQPAPDPVARDARPPSTMTPLPAQSSAKDAPIRPEGRTQSADEPAPRTPRTLTDTKPTPLPAQQRSPATATATATATAAPKQALTQPVHTTASPAGTVTASPATLEIPEPSTNQRPNPQQPVVQAAATTAQPSQSTLPQAIPTVAPAIPAQSEARPPPAPSNPNPPHASSPTTPTIPASQPVQPPNIVPPPIPPLAPSVSRIPATPPIPQPTQAPIAAELTRVAASSGQSQPAPVPAAPAPALSAFAVPQPAVITDRSAAPPLAQPAQAANVAPAQAAPQPAQASPEMQAVVQVLTRLPGPETADLLRTSQPAALEQQAANADTENAADDPYADVPDLRLDLIAAPLDRNGGGYRYDQPNGADTAENDALIAEADLSVLGFFRLETRPAAQGLNVVIRHAEPLNAAGLEALGAAAEAEAQRFGIQARVKFRHEPELEPT